MQNSLARIFLRKTDFIIFKTLLNTGLLHPAELLQGFSSNLAFHKVCYLIIFGIKGLIQDFDSNLVCREVGARLLQNCSKIVE